MGPYNIIIIVVVVVVVVVELLSFIAIGSFLFLQIFGEIKDMRSLNGGGKDETAHMMVEFLQGKMSDSVTHAASAGSKGHS